MTVAGQRLIVTVTLIAPETADIDEVGEYVFNLIGNYPGFVADAMVSEIETYGVELADD